MKDLEHPKEILARYIKDINSQYYLLKHKIIEVFISLIEGFNEEIIELTTKYCT
jgi:hypothetical protein